jgi:hypothetical protein
MLYRRFSFMQSRLLLEKQDKLRVLEKKLDSLDHKMHDSDDRNPMTRDLGSRTFSDNPNEKVIDRKDALFNEMEKEYCSYGKILIRHYWHPSD